jgi:hypothetical protein
MLCEDQRTAANMTVTLSTQLMAASLAVIAVEGAIYTFVNDKRLTSFAFTASVLFCFLFFMLSIYTGGRGVNEVRKAVFTGNWTIDKVKNPFALQAFFGVLGLICLFMSLTLPGKPKEESTQQDLTNLKATVEKQQQAVDTLKKQLEEIHRVR